MQLYYQLDFIIKRDAQIKRQNKLRRKHFLNFNEIYELLNKKVGTMQLNMENMSIK